MAKDYLYVITNNILFYRNKLRLLNRLGIILLFIVIGFVAYSIYRISSIQEPAYFATTSDGRLINLTPAQ